MSKSFWGHRMLPGQAFPFTESGILQLSQVTLESDPKPGKTILKVKAKGHVWNLCTLTADTVERQVLSHFFIAEDKATFMLTGPNAVNLIGIMEHMENDDSSNIDDAEEDQESDDERETITGQPRYANYLSDLLGPDLPDEDDEDYYEDIDESQDDYGALAFRDPSDTNLLGGFELRHFNLVPTAPGYEKVDLRKEEESLEDTFLNDNIAKGLLNALLNSGDSEQARMEKKRGKQLLKTLTKQIKQRESS